MNRIDIIDNGEYRSVNIGGYTIFPSEANHFPKIDPNACDYCRRIHAHEECPGCGAPRLKKRTEYQPMNIHMGYGYPS